MWIRESHHNESFSTNYSHIICHDPFVERIQSAHTHIFERYTVYTIQRIEDSYTRSIFFNICVDVRVFVYLTNFLPILSARRSSTHLHTHSYSLFPSTKCYVFKSVFYALLLLLLLLYFFAFALLIMLMWIFSCDNAQ